MQGLAGVDLCAIVRYCERMEFAFFGQRLRAIRKGQFIRHEPMGLRELARITGINPSTISQWESGLRWRDKLPPADDVRRLADALAISFDQLTGNMDKSLPEPLPEIQRLPLAALLDRIGAQPVYGEYVEDVKASAGRRGARIPQGAEDRRVTRRAREKTPERIQVVEVVGRCMEDLLFPGDRVHVDTQQTPEIGKIVVAVRFHDETIVKYLRGQDERQYLEGRDGTVVPLDQYTRIVGPVTWYQRRL